MWIAVLFLLAIMATLLVSNISLREQLDTERRRANREASLRAATEIAFCEVVEEQIGDRLRTNRRMVSEVTERFDKARNDGRTN